jgi:hypothetical protein
MQAADGSIKLEQQYSRPACWGDTNNARSVQNDMFGPSVAAWIKKWNHYIGERIDTCEVRSFVAVARQTGESKVMCLSVAAVFEGHMVNFVSVYGDVLVY